MIKNQFVSHFEIRCHFINLTKELSHFLNFEAFKFLRNFAKVKTKIVFFTIFFGKWPSKKLKM
jgi:hypothetical protein